MTVLILGGSGLVGSYLKTELEKTYNVTATSRSGNNPFVKFDITKEETFSVFNTNYDFIVDCTVDYDLTLNEKLRNEVLGKEKLLRILSQKRSHYIAISSVSATEANKYLSDYNFSKYLSDETIRHFSKLYDLKSTILRFAQIFDYNEKAKKIQGAIYYFIDSFKNNTSLNVFGDVKLRRSYIPIEVLVKTVKKNMEEKITGTHDVIMPDSYSSEDLIREFGKIVSFSDSNLNYQPEKKVAEYQIPDCSPVFTKFLGAENCMPYFKNLLLKK